MSERLVTLRILMPRRPAAPETVIPGDNLSRLRPGGTPGAADRLAAARSVRRVGRPIDPAGGDQ